MNKMAIETWLLRLIVSHMASSIECCLESHGKGYQDGRVRCDAACFQGRRRAD